MTMIRARSDHEEYRWLSAVGVRHFGRMVYADTATCMLDGRRDSAVATSAHPPAATSEDARVVDNADGDACAIFRRASIMGLDLGHPETRQHPIDESDLVAEIRLPVFKDRPISTPETIALRVLPEMESRNRTTPRISQPTSAWQSNVRRLSGSLLTAAIQEG